MKKLIYFISTTVLLSVIVSSCTQVDLPYETFPDLKKGAYARLTNQDGVFDFFNPATSVINSSVEFYDENKGGNVQTYSWTVEFIDNSPGFGSGPIAPVAVGDTSTTIGSFSAPFAADPVSGLPAQSMSFGFTDALIDLGITIADVTGGDVVRFQATITMVDGETTFDATNTGSNIFSSSSFKALFTINAGIVCLPEPGYFTGDYAMVQTSGGSDPFFGNPVRFLDLTSEVTEGSSPTIREFEVDYLGAFFLTFQIDLVCGDVLVPNVPSGVGCGGDITWSTDAVAATYDPLDDSVMIINFIDDSTDDCGINDAGYVLTMTKQ